MKALLILSSLPLLGWALAGTAPPPGEASKIDPAVERLLAKGQPRPVLLMGATQLLDAPGAFDRFCLERRHAKRSALRREVIGRLKEIASAEQAVILEKLGLGCGRRHRPLWIVNAIAVELSPDEIRRAAGIGEVRYIYDGQALPEELPTGAVSLLLDPVERTPFTTLGKTVPWNLRDIGAERCWTEAGITGEGTLVAMLDSGANYAHEDLRRNIWINGADLPNNGLDDDGNGYIDDRYGYDFLRMTPEVRAAGPGQHGTWTSGIVAGDGSGGIVTGVAPRARLMVLCCGGKVVPAALAHQYALEQGADVMNMSFALPDLGALRGFWRRMSEHAVCAGLVLSGGAGNFQKSAKVPAQIWTPKDIPCVIAVGGVDPGRKLVSFSSLGPVEWGSVPFYRDHPMPAGLVKPDISAFPGAGYPVLSCSDDDAGYVNKNETIRGNSFSGPHVSGIAALIFAASPELPAWRVKEILEETATDLDEPGKDVRTGAGLADAFRAVRRAQDLSREDSGRP